MYEPAAEEQSGCLSRGTTNRVGHLVLCALLGFRKIDSCAGNTAASSGGGNLRPSRSRISAAVDCMAADRTTSVDMERNNDLRLCARRPRRAKDVEPELSRRSGFEFEIIGFAH